MTQHHPTPSVEHHDTAARLGLGEARWAVWADDWDAGLALCGRHLERVGLVGGAPQKVLDVGCGVGRLMVPLLREGHEVTGCEPSPWMRMRAREHLDASGFSDIADPCRWQLVTDVPLYDTFDAVVCVAVFQHLDQADQYLTLAKVNEVLRPGGRLLLQVQTEGESGPMSHPVDRFRLRNWLGRLGMDLLDERGCTVYPTWTWYLIGRPT